MTGDTAVNNDSGDAPGPDPTSSTASLPVPKLQQNDSTTSTQDSKISSAVQRSTKQIRKARSWYESWPAPPKAQASTSVARENILGGSVRSKRQSDLSRFDTKKDSDSISVQSTATRAEPDPKPSDEMSPKGEDSKPAGEQPTPDQPEPSGSAPDEGSAIESHPPSQSKQPEHAEQPAQPEPHDTTTQQPATSAGWLGWWNKAPVVDTQETVQSPTQDAVKPDDKVDVETPNAPETTGSEPTQAEEASDPPVEEPANPSTQEPEKPATTSWFARWSTAKAPQTDPASAETAESTSVEQQTVEEAPVNDAPPAAPEVEAEPAPTTPAASASAPSPKAGSTWAFWSKDSSSKKGAPTTNESGEIAVMGEGTESHPAPMAEDSVSSPSEPAKEAPLKDIKERGGRSTWKRNKRSRPVSVDLDNNGQTPPATPQEPNLTKPDDSKSTVEAAAVPPNLLLPLFSSTYQPKENPSLIKQLTQLLMGSQQPPPNHVFRVSTPPKIRKAIAIGIHGFFPATYLRPMIGQPTGTSLRFANLCADAIRRWADANGSSSCEIEKVALEGEGKINERVDNLWKLMLNWIDHIRSADLILIASHSQGVPVSIMLLEKLIDLGIITEARIGVCAMAGVSLGPFPEYQSSLLGASANELWEFGNPESQNSQKLEKAVKKVLDCGARITFIGSIDDQLVPLDSALYSPAHHPYIYRAVFIDGRTHAPDFIAHLVGFALKLRNLGITDHGLIRELSLPLAGSLYSGEGHSRLYYETAVYDLAVSHSLETTPASGHTPPAFVRRPVTTAPPPSSNADGAAAKNAAVLPNPYVLPWIMRGLLEEDLVKTELSGEAGELLQQFDDWRPATKALRDVKYRLEAVRSKL